ncbi:hypothetical protein OPQ81_003678 [Rhizoctonia solani]|nr:hypothetical protein OPQ81_003678 [Rhizoctonia solani]
MGKGLSATQVGARLCYLVIDTAILYRLAHQYQLLLVPPAIPMLRSTSLLMCCLLGRCGTHIDKGLNGSPG